jgi:thioredoxin-like negative regulator of GroEL
VSSDPTCLRQSIAFGKIDVDDNADAAAAAQIGTVPTFVLYHGGSPINTSSGADSNQLRSSISALAEANGVDEVGRAVAHHGRRVERDNSRLSNHGAG